MLPGETAQRTAMTKQGSCARTHIPLACKPNQPPPPEKKHFQASLPGTIPPDTHLSARHHPPQMQTGSPPLPPSSRCDLWLHEGVATLVVLRPTPAALKSSCGGQLMRASSTPLLLLRILLQPEKKAPEDGENYGGAVSPRTLTLY